MSHPDRTVLVVSGDAGNTAVRATLFVTNGHFIFFHVAAPLKLESDQTLVRI